MTYCEISLDRHRCCEVYWAYKALRFISSSCGEVFRLTHCPLTTDHAFILVRSGKSVLVNLHFLPLNDQTRPPVMSELCRAGWLSLYPSSQSERGAEGPEHTACKDPRTPGWNRHLKVWSSPPSSPNLPLENVGNSKYDETHQDVNNIIQCQDEHQTMKVFLFLRK